MAKFAIFLAYQDSSIHHKFVQCYADNILDALIEVHWYHAKDISIVSSCGANLVVRSDRKWLR